MQWFNLKYSGSTTDSDNILDSINHVDLQINLFEYIVRRVEQTFRTLAARLLEAGLQLVKVA